VSWEGLKAGACLLAFLCAMSDEGACPRSCNLFWERLMGAYASLFRCCEGLMGAHAAVLFWETLTEAHACLSYFGGGNDRDACHLCYSHSVHRAAIRAMYLDKDSKDHCVDCADGSQCI